MNAPHSIALRRKTLARSRGADDWLSHSAKITAGNTREQNCRIQKLKPMIKPAATVGHFELLSLNSYHTHAPRSATKKPYISVMKLVARCRKIGFTTTSNNAMQRGPPAALPRRIR